MGSKSKKEKEIHYLTQQNQQQFQQAVQEAKQPTELQKRLEGDARKWLDYVEGKNGPVDYTRAPGLVHLGMFDEAMTNRLAERTATGGLQMGSSGANATAVALRKQELADEMAQRKGESLVNAVRAKDASVHGEIAPFLIGTDEARKRALLSTSAGMAQGSLNAYAALPARQPWWQDAIAAGAGVAGKMFL